MDLALIIAYLQTHTYIALYLISIIEGPVVTIIAAFFSSFNYLNVYIVYLIAMLGDLTGDVVYYSAGRYSKNGILEKIIKFFKISEEKMLNVNKFYKRHGGKSIFLSKFLSGLAIPTIIGAGVSKMKFQTFFFYSFITSIVKTAIFVVTGYYFGQFYLKIDEYIGVIGRTIFAVIVAGIIVYFLSKKLRKRN
ncbi:MAG: DedA family protein [Nanoarchaeota archaeon]